MSATGFKFFSLLAPSAYNISSFKISYDKLIDVALCKRP